MSSPELHKPAVAIMASGQGTTAEAFLRAMRAGKIDVEVPIVISNNEHPGVFSRVRGLRLGIDTVHIGPNQFGWRVGEHEARGMTPWQSERIAEELQRRDIAHVALMGYMQVVAGVLLEEYGWWPRYRSIYRGRMTNTHPGPLPLTANTMGADAAERVLASDRKTSEHTVHLVAEEVDRGPIIARHRVPVLPGDTKNSLNARVQETERENLPLDIDAFLKEQADFNIRNRRKR